MKKRKGFTLIELMIAMAIIAILAAAGIQAYTGYMKKGRDTARAEIASNLNSSVMAYAASNGGNPPATQTAFDTFLRDAGETFGGGGGVTGAFIKDPVWGKAVCLDAEWKADQPCQFDYTAYDDGTYAISYGVEDKSSTEENFYKTTKSVPINNSEVTKPIDAQTTKPKYGVYVWSAKYIGQPATTQNVKTGSTYTPGNDNDWVDQQYTPPGSGGQVVPLIVTFRSVRLDVPVVTGGGGMVGDEKMMTFQQLLQYPRHLQHLQNMYCITNMVIHRMIFLIQYLSPMEHGKELHLNLSPTNGF